jgi:predicted DCC family thiol-disulfide oxidoreductase YuxK
MLSDMNLEETSGLRCEDPVILFDGVCNLCSGWTRFVLRFDGARRFKLCTLQSEAGQSILRAAGLPTSDFKTVVLVRAGKVWLKSDAVLAVLSELTFPWPIAGVLTVLPRWIRDRAYDFVAARRYKFFGKQDSCVLPLPEDRSRFL